MTAFRILTVVAGTFLALGEVARWWGDVRFIPLAFDEILIGVVMVGAALMAQRTGPVGLVVSWAGFSGFMLSLLVPTIDHLLNGPPKESAVFYTLILSVMLFAGIGATIMALRHCRIAEQRSGR